mmetsp:Transcript_101239/g.241436  ORF Transcript_101239/g.241436 Transcript_101239/m.241436 type:complete len:203 (+) Transcript_101239:228-836(+)
MLPSLIRSRIPCPRERSTKTSSRRTTLLANWRARPSSRRAWAWSPHSQDRSENSTITSCVATSQLPSWRGQHDSRIEQRIQSLRADSTMISCSPTSQPSSWIILLGNRRLHGGRRSSECESGRSGSRSLCQGGSNTMPFCGGTTSFARNQSHGRSGTALSELGSKPHDSVHSTMLAYAPASSVYCHSLHDNRMMGPLWLFLS